MSSELTVECISGVLHEGTPTGKFEKIAGVDTYVAFPPEGTPYNKEHAILFFPGIIYGIYQIMNG